MEARAKSSNTPHPIWVQGEYITEPPVRPVDKVKRPAGCYIDKGGYPGANVYEVAPDTLCMATKKVDCHGCRIFESDILLCEEGEEIAYFIIQDTETAVDIIYGEIIGISELQAGDIQVIGNVIDFPDFVEGIRYCVDKGKEIPYLPVLDVLKAPHPFLKLTCVKCGRTVLSGAYMARHRECGGYMMAGFATRVYRKRKMPT